MGKQLSAVIGAVLLTAGTAAAGQSQAAVDLRVTRAGAPATRVGIEFQFLNQGKVAVGVTDTSGTLAVAMSAVNGGKPTRVQVVMYDCPADQQIVVFVEQGGTLVEKTDCKRRVAGWLWFGRNPLVTVDLAHGTIASARQQTSGITIRDRVLMLTAGLAAPTGQLGDEAKMGWQMAAAVRVTLAQLEFAKMCARFRVEHARFPNAEGMPDNFAASQTSLNIDTVFSFGDDKPLMPFVAAGAGLARNVISFGESSISSWKPGFNVGGGLEYRLNDKSTIGTELRYQKFGTFGAASVSGTYTYSF